MKTPGGKPDLGGTREGENGSIDNGEALCLKRLTHDSCQKPEICDQCNGEQDVCERGGKSA